MFLACSEALRGSNMDTDADSPLSVTSSDMLPRCVRSVQRISPQTGELRTSFGTPTLGLQSILPSIGLSCARDSRHDPFYFGRFSTRSRMRSISDESTWRRLGRSGPWRPTTLGPAFGSSIRCCLGSRIHRSRREIRATALVFVGR